ncbi:MAG: CheR family methyltransferase [Tepidimonas sp.]|uniref:CheR family methyltransferase n=1 Tax=Tepidimonas sp. TaxID=2002775 RepID=UPI00259F6889|nr:CheR family methyltransferase [Tepidimonas sp.]MDM7456999.1 CheR family methyltransferase [Tepidimonas sp.]
MMRDAAAALQSREFAWTVADFDRIRQLIYRHAGISLHEGKQAMVYSRISRRLRETGHDSFRAYLDWLESSQDAAEWQEFVNALTTNLTSFFRENHHFVELARLVRESASQRDWKIWCSAASTGEEPYSIAITMADVLGLQGAFRIWASDIDTRVLQTAQRGVYKLDQLRSVTPEQLRRYFLRGKGANEGLARVKPELQKHLQFFTLNLVDEVWPLREEFDVIFCRNVMIYFDHATQRQVLGRLHRLLRPHGTLFVGHAENFSDARDLFRLRGKTIYEKL